MRFLEEAEAEYLAALSYYDDIDRQLAEDLIRCTDEGVAQALEFPHLGHLQSGFEEHGELRRYVIRRFPYSLLTGTLRGERVVVAFAHHKRKPGYWSSRIP